MLAKHTKSEPAAWIVRDIYARSDVKTCWVLMVDGARFVPGDCSDCGGDTLVDLNTRREDDGDCARCGAKGATIFYDGCRDSFTLMHFVAVAIFGAEPEAETLECECCKRVLELQHFRLDGNDVCSWCLDAAAVATAEVKYCVMCILPCGAHMKRKLAPGRACCTECVAGPEAVSE